MVLNRIRRSLSSDEGAAVPLILAIILVVMVVFAALFQFFSARATLNTIRDTCYSVAETALIANAETSYQAKRDGYTGVWHLDGAAVSDSVVYIDVSTSLAQQLNLISEDEDLVKTDGERQMYRLRNIQLTIQNPDFQNENTALVATVSLVVDMNLKLPLMSATTVPVPVEVSAAWNRNF